MCITWMKLIANGAWCHSGRHLLAQRQTFYLSSNTQAVTYLVKFVVKGKFKTYWESAIVINKSYMEAFKPDSQGEPKTNPHSPHLALLGLCPLLQIWGELAVKRASKRTWAEIGRAMTSHSLEMWHNAMSKTPKVDHSTPKGNNTRSNIMTSVNTFNSMKKRHSDIQ